MTMCDLSDLLHPFSLRRISGAHSVVLQLLRFIFRAISFFQHTCPLIHVALPFLLVLCTVIIESLLFVTCTCVQII